MGNTRNLGDIGRIPDNDLGGLVFLRKEVVSSSVSAVDLDLPAGYTRYKLCVDGLTNDTALTWTVAQISTDGGSTFISTGYKYMANFYKYGGSSLTVSSSASTSIMALKHDEAVSGASNPNNDQSATFEIISNENAFAMQGFGDCNGVGAFISNRREMTAKADTIRIYYLSNNIATGRFSLYGYKETL